MSKALIALLQQGLSREVLQRIIVLCRGCYDDDPLLCGVCLVMTLSLIDLWEDTQAIAFEKDEAIQALQQPWVAWLQTERADSNTWIARLEAVFRVWRGLLPSA